MAWVTTTSKRLLVALTLSGFGVLGGGCGNDRPGGVADQTRTGMNDHIDRCVTPNDGCACDEPSRVVECGAVDRESAGHLWCSMGHRTCGADGTWGECQPEFVKLLDTPGPGVKAQAKGSPTACTTNPCDPFCELVTDSGNDYPLPTGFQQTPDGGITLLPRDASLMGSGCTSIKVTPTPQVLTIKGIGGSTPGLRGDYFNERFGDDLVPSAATPTATRIDSQVSFTWGGSPVAGLGGDNFTVRWTGYVRPKVSGAYTFCTTSDDGVRLWVGGSKVVDHWSDHGTADDCAVSAANLTAGTLYPVRMEFYENGGDALAALRWKHGAVPGGEVIPSDMLMPPGGEMQLGPLTIDPPNAKFEVEVVPPGCFDGPVNALWSSDRLDRASVDSTGKVSLFAPVAGDITVTAYAGTFHADGVVKVNVEASDVTLAPTGSVATFQNAPSGTDPMTVLYPYVDTVFPLALRAPTIQWDTGGTAASAVKISLRSPATGTPIFDWSAIVPESSPGRYAIPQEAWSALGATAKGKTASYSVQRITGGVARPPVVRGFQFAKAPLRGKIYYTQYARDGSTNMMVTDPGSALPASSVFANDSGGSWGVKCPVCHTVSASGNMFATSDGRWSSNAGLSKINTDGSFDLLTDYSTDAKYQQGADDWRGFAWAPLTPDGKLALAANNIWGNSRQAVVGIDPATRAVSLPGGFESGGNGTGLLAKYYMNRAFTGWDWRRIDPKVDFDWTGGSPGGPVPAAFSALWTGQVQALSSEQYTFSVLANGGVRLSVDGQVIIDELGNTANTSFTGTATLVRGQKVPIALSFASAAAAPQVMLLWGSPSFDAQVVPQTQLYPNDGPHGVLATYYDQNDFTQPFITDRLEASLDLDYDFGRPSPMPSADSENWSALYRGQLEAPATGDLTLCADANDDVVVTFAGTELINHAGEAETCAAAGAVTAGTLYDLEVRLREYTGRAYVNLRWEMSGATTFGRESVPSARLRPPAGYVAPVHGLTATYYDDDRFNASQGTGSTVLAATRIEPNLDLTWGDSQPDQSALTNSDFFSSRFTGQIEAECPDIYELELDADDSARLWIDGVRVIDLKTFGTDQSAIWLDRGKHDLKLDHVEGQVLANVNLSWRARCLGLTAFTPVPTERLYPEGDQGTGGYELAGGDNGNDSDYFVWQTPAAPGGATEVTATSPGVWGLGNSVMMVPSFAPDSSKLVFVDGDSAGGNGWRKGLSVFDFDQAGKAFKHRKTVVSTWPSGDVIKWPVFESDSRSVIYQQTVPGDACCRKTDWAKYGYMGPTNYFEDPGRLFSVDTQAENPVPVELATLNRGERALDRNKSYQATMLPQASAGYRWAVFTSTRPYGNTLNQQSQGQQDFSNTASYTYISEYEKVQSMLWVSAIDDTPSAGADRSHPAFFLPAQNFNEDPANGFVNERAYWVTEACRPAGTNAASSCDVDEDCCGGSEGTAVCRIDTPTTAPPTRHCFQVPGQCVPKGQACVTNCCNGTVCDDGVCVTPPPLNKFQPTNFERIYESDCASGQKVDWTFFDYKASVPAEGSLEFYAESADALADFHTLPATPNSVSIDGVVWLGTQNPGGDPTRFTYLDVNAKLKDASLVDRHFLKITVRFTPNVAGTEAPVLTEWRQAFSCPPGE